MRYRWENTELDVGTYELRVDGARVAVEPQVFEVLSYLLQHRERLVPRTELLDQVWGDRFVTDSALSSRIAAARTAIGDDGRTQRVIRTVHGRGFQFVAEVEAAWPRVLPALVPDGDEPAQTVRFVTAPDGQQLAVATAGDGIPLVKAANWLTHVEKDWRSPVWWHWWSGLAARFRFFRYDARGCGLSDQNLDGTDLTDLSVWTGDLEAVVDATDVDRFVLLGISQGAAPAMDYAVRHPKRVAHLVLYGGYCRGMRQRGDAGIRESDALVELTRLGWGGRNPAFRSVFTMTFLPDATSEQIRWFSELQEMSTSTENAVLLESAFYESDFSDLARRIRVPTTVMHCCDDRATPYEEGRRLAGAIPDAEFVTLESANHILTEAEPAWQDFLAHLDRIRAEI